MFPESLVSKNGMHISSSINQNYVISLPIVPSQIKTIRNIAGDFKSNHLLKGSFVVLIGSLVAAVGNYFFNIIMGRMLGPEDFGALVSLLALTYIIAVPSQTINIVTARYTARYQAKGESGKISSFIIKANRNSFLLGLVAFGAFAVISPAIARYLHLTSTWLVIILGASFLISFVASVNTGGLRGLHNFTQLSINSVLTVGLKIAIATGLVYLSFGVKGALIAFSLCLFIANFQAYFSLKLSKKRSLLGLKLSQIFSYSSPVFLTSLCIAVLYNVDVILAKHFLDSTAAGHYAVLSLLGKIIFFATGSIVTVMFPMAVKKIAQGKSHIQILRRSIFLVLIVSALICAIYFLFPEFIVNLLFGANYVAVAAYLGWFGLVILIFSLVNVVANYYLSIQRTDFWPILAFGVVLEIVMIYVFHQNIGQIVWSLLFTMILVLVSLIIFLNVKKSAELETKH